MKAIRFMMMAVMSVFFSTSFVSCLDDGDNRQMYERYVSVDSYIVDGDYLTTDDGIILKPTNPSALKFTNPDGKTTMIPKRAYIVFYTVDDVPFPQEGVTTYDIEIYGASYIDLKTLEQTPIQPVAPFTAIGKPAEVGSFVDFAAQFKFEELSLSNCKMYIEKAENQTIYVNIVNVEDNIEDLSTASTLTMNFSFFKPSKSYMENYFDGFEVPADGKVSLQITAKGIPTEGSTKYEDKKAETIKITLK